MSYFRENIEKAKGYEPGFQPKETDVVKLNTNENPYPPSPAVMKAVAEIEPERLRRYPDPIGNAFRQAAAEVNGVSADHIMCCNGGDDREAGGCVSCADVFAVSGISEAAELQGD
jgi:histidinol-phosphate aminotransferase